MLKNNQDRAIAYCETATMKDRFPMATPAELRDDAFAPLTRFAPGVDTSSRSRDLVFKDKEGNVTGTLTVTGPAREIHRAFLDYLFAFCKPFLMEAGPIGLVPVFFVRKYQVAKSLFGDGSRTDRFDELVNELKEKVSVRYTRAGVRSDRALDRNTLVLFTGTLRRLADEDRLGSIEQPLRELLRKRAGGEVDFDDYTMVVLCPDYLSCFRDQTAVRYHAHVEAILGLEDPVARQVARYALSNEFLTRRPLKQILEEIGVTGRTTAWKASKELLEPSTRAQLDGMGIQIEDTPEGPMVSYQRDRTKALSFKGLDTLYQRHETADAA